MLEDEEIIAGKLVDFERDGDLGDGQKDEDHYKNLAAEIVEALAEAGYHIVRA